MNQELLDGLVRGETDVEGALKRICNDEVLYCRLLSSFLGDATMENLGKAIKEESWDEAFTAAHALKGLAGNLGFVPLFHSVGELVVLIRSGKISDVEESYHKIERCYDDIIYIIRDNIGLLTGKAEESAGGNR